MSIAVIYALSATLLFSLASIAFTSFSRSISVIWMNFFKASIASIGFLLLALSTRQFEFPGLNASLLLASSGILGLCIGDMFLLKSFKDLGPGRTLVLFSFHPIFTGVGSYFLFGQGLSGNQFIAILFMLACLICLGKENMDKNKSWSIGPLLIALLAISLDAGGVLLTRQAFELSPNLDSSMANFIRSGSCFLTFSMWSAYKPIGLIKHLQALSKKNQAIVFLAASFGTFLSLYFYLNALKLGHLATISAIAATGPLWAAIFEYVFFKQKPSKLLYVTFGLFTVGMIFINS